MSVSLLGKSVFVGSLLIMGVLIAPGSAASANPVPPGFLIPAGPGIGETPANAPADSYNWSGDLAATSGSATYLDEVDSEWVVPVVNCHGGTTTDASQWVGLGGDEADDTLYQTGIDFNCSAGSVNYKVWWEVVPGYTEQDYKVKAGVKPDDVISAEVYFSGTEMEMTISDVRNGTTVWVKRTTKPDFASSESAECIVERPTIGKGYNPLTDFYAVTFPYCEGEYVLSDESHGFDLHPSGIKGLAIGLLNMIDTSGTTLASTTQTKTSPYPVKVTWDASS